LALRNVVYWTLELTLVVVLLWSIQAGGVAPFGPAWWACVLLIGAYGGICKNHG
jgi:hypothetical protein